MSRLTSRQYSPIPNTIRLFILPRLFILSICLPLVAFQSAHAQESTGDPVSFAFVQLLASDGSLADFAFSGADGRFVLQNFGPGTYSIVVSHASFPTATVEGLEFQPGDELILTGTFTTDGLFLDIVLDPDSDNDGTPDSSDQCPIDPNKIVPGQCGCGNAETDTDGDGISDCVDNCPLDVNPLQEDGNNNGVGDACDNIATVCSYLGDQRRRSRLDRDIFTISGTKGEEVQLSLEKFGDDHKGNSATLLLIDRIRRVRLLRIDKGNLPNEIQVTLPASGTYKVVIAEQPQWRWWWWRFFHRDSFSGDYCLTIKSSENAFNTLNGTRWVE